MIIDQIFAPTPKSKGLLKVVKNSNVGHLGLGVKRNLAVPFPPTTRDTQHKFYAEFSPFSSIQSVFLNLHYTSPFHIFANSGKPCGKSPVHDSLP